LNRIEAKDFYLKEYKSVNKAMKTIVLDK